MKPVPITPGKEPKPGDQVRVLQGEKPRIGVVVRLFTKERGKRGKLGKLARQFGIETTSYHRMAEVAGVDGTWYSHSPLSQLEVCGKGDLEAARATVLKIQGNRQSFSAAARQEREQKIEDAGFLLKLKPGDRFEVKFRNVGFRLCTFLGIVPSSGRVRFHIWPSGKTQFAEPSWCRAALQPSKK